jgi:hypothetical protein
MFGKKKSKVNSKFLDKYMNQIGGMSEEEQMKLAIKKSLKEKKKEEGGDEERKNKKFKKTQFSLLSSESFSKNFENLYDDEKTSDCLIKFENGNKIFTHTLILSINSEHFSTLFEEGLKEIVVNKEDDEKIVRTVIKFLYTGSFDYTNEDDIVPFLIYCNNVSFFLYIQKVWNKKHQKLEITSKEYFYINYKLY